MTEDEAKKKWCPFARTATFVHSGVNRFEDTEGVSSPLPSALCIGSDCMAWRVERVFDPLWIDALMRRLVEEDRDATEAEKERGVIKTGFCGMGGRLGAP